VDEAVDHRRGDDVVAEDLTLRLPPGYGLLAEILARLRALPAMP
jgi:hypothetical protein